MSPSSGGRHHADRLAGDTALGRFASRTIKLSVCSSIIQGGGKRVIDPDDKETNKDVIEKAVNAIGKADYTIYVLGYGFDENTSDRLELPRQLHCERAKGKSVFFTNFQDINRVTKRASETFSGRPNLFPQGHLVTDTGNNNHYERSLRNVYEALELDFNWFN